jgi:hypothetical protein
MVSSCRATGKPADVNAGYSNRFAARLTPCRAGMPCKQRSERWARPSSVEATKGLDDQKLADYIRKTTFKTVVGDIRFGPNGELDCSRVVQVQFQHIKGNDVAQFKGISTQVIVTPDEFKSGEVIYPYEKAKE